MTCRNLLHWRVFESRDNQDFWYLDCPLKERALCRPCFQKDPILSRLDIFDLFRRLVRHFWILFQTQMLVAFFMDWFWCQFHRKPWDLHWSSRIFSRPGVKIFHTSCHRMNLLKHLVWATYWHLFWFRNNIFDSCRCIHGCKLDFIHYKKLLIYYHSHNH